MPTDTIVTPGDYIGAIAIAFGAEGAAATLVSAENPLPTTGGGGGGGGGDASAANQVTIIGHVNGIEAELANILAKIIAAPATEATLASVDGHVDGIEGSLTSILAKIIAAPSTEAKQDTIIAAVDGVEASLASILAKIIAAPATEAKQDTMSAKLPASLGAKGAAASMSVIQAGLEYETVAASQTAQALGATGASGDYLSHVVFQPTAVGAGTCTILDNATVIYTFTTGTLGDLRPIVVPINAFSVSGAWKLTTGASITATAFGDFAA